MLSHWLLRLSANLPASQSPRIIGMSPVTWVPLLRGPASRGRASPGLPSCAAHGTLPVPTGWCVTAPCCCASRRGFTSAASTYGGLQGGVVGCPPPTESPQHTEACQSLGCAMSPLPAVLQSPVRAGGRGGRKLPHLHSSAPSCCDGSICFLSQTFGGALLLALNPYQPLPLFSPEVLASYHPGKTPNTTP